MYRAALPWWRKNRQHTITISHRNPSRIWVAMKTKLNEDEQPAQEARRR